MKLGDEPARRPISAGDEGTQRRFFSSLFPASLFPSVSPNRLNPCKTRFCVKSSCALAHATIRPRTIHLRTTRKGRISSAPALCLLPLCASALSSSLRLCLCVKRFNASEYLPKCRDELSNLVNAWVVAQPGICQKRYCPTQSRFRVAPCT